MWVYELDDPKCVTKDLMIWDTDAVRHTSPGFILSPTLCQQRKVNHTKVFLTFHHILLVVTVIVTVCGSVIDIKAMDGSIVVTCWNIL